MYVYYCMYLSVRKHIRARLGLHPNIQNSNKLYTSDDAVRRGLLLYVGVLELGWAGLGWAWLGLTGLCVVCTSILVRDLVLVRQVLRVQQ